MSKKQKRTSRRMEAGREKGKNNRGTKRKRKDSLGLFFVIAQLAVSVAFMGVLFLLDMLPIKYLVLSGLLLFFFWCITFQSQTGKKKKRAVGKAYSLLLVCVLTLGTYYVAKVNNVIGMITGGGYKVDKMVVAVLVDDPAETIGDTADYNFGVQFQRGGENMQAAITDIQAEVGKDISVTECGSVQDQAAALRDGKVQAIIYNDAYTQFLEEEFENYKDHVKIIYEHKIRVEMNFGDEGDNSLTQKPFTVYISGIDTYGEITEASRSDVNIIAVVNPKTHQVLLVTTPRDYYVEIPGISYGAKDKLTHAGTYGIDASMATLAQLYETEINYYVRLNFTSMIDIIDTLGGVDVYSELAFQTGQESGCEVEIQEGYNHLNGKQALAFCRERHNIANGDTQRGKHQQAVITAMLKKCLSPTMLLKAGTIMNQVSGEIEMNVTQSQLNALIKNQLRTNSKWNIRSVSAEGFMAKGYCYSMSGRLLSIIEPDYDNVNQLIQLINVVEEGGVLEETQTLN